MGLMKAAKNAPDAVLLPTDFDEYRKYSRLFKAAVRAIAPHVEDRGIDEIYIDLTDSWQRACGTRCRAVPTDWCAFAGTEVDVHARPHARSADDDADAWWSAREIARELKRAVRDATGLSLLDRTGAQQADRQDRL